MVQAPQCPSAVWRQFRSNSVLLMTTLQPISSNLHNLTQTVLEDIQADWDNRVAPPTSIPASPLNHVNHNGASRSQPRNQAQSCEHRHTGMKRRPKQRGQNSKTSLTGSHQASSPARLCPVRQMASPRLRR